VKIRATSWLILFAIALMSGDYTLAAEGIILRTSVTQENPWVGQQVILHVDVLAKDGWAQLKKIGDAQVGGAYLLRLESQGTRLRETIEGDNYTGQRYEFLLFAQRAGVIAVPPLPVDVEVTSLGAGADSRVRRMSTRGIEFIVRTPPGAEGIRGLISTTRLTATQRWEPEIASQKVGDAIKRTVTLRAEDVSGMAFTPMSQSAIEHLGIYPGEPTVDDNFARGDLTGTRVEPVTYVFERSGEFELPEIVLHWWDVRNEELKRIELPGLSLQVSGSAIQSVPVGISARQKNMLLCSVLIASLAAVVVVYRFRGRVADRWTTWKKVRSVSEAACFRRVRRSFRSRDRAAVLRETMRWLDRINDDSGPARLDQFLQRYGDPKVQEAAAELTHGLALDRDKSDFAMLLSGLTTARKRWRQEQRRRRRVVGVLPGLNGGAL